MILSFGWKGIYMNDFEVKEKPLQIIASVYAFNVFILWVLVFFIIGSL